MLGFEAAPRRDVSNIQNWITRYACIARKETTYLDLRDDLLGLGTSEDSVMTWLEELIEGCLITLYERFYKVRFRARQQPLKAK